ncbi:MAG: type II secretion system protein [Alphaproteobacteria bacterium]|nr:type II secretion system protein [Alphaproteobacteria bacterium]
MKRAGFGVRRRQGQTMIELAIVMATILLLAGLGFSFFNNIRNRVRVVEAVVNAEGIQTAQVAHFVGSKDNEFVEIVAWAPDNQPGPTLRAWAKNTGFDELGWSPDGDVRCSYRSPGFGTDQVQVQVLCDLDGDRSRILVPRDVTLAMANGGRWGQRAASPDICVFGPTAGIPSERLSLRTHSSCYATRSEAGEY